MKTRFYLDRLLAKGLLTIFVAYLVVMIAISLLNGRFLENINLFLIVGGLILLFWLGFTRGSYITIDGQNVYGKVFLIRGKTTQIPDIISIRRNPTFAGLMSEVVMGVRKKDGTITERGLINKPGLTESDFKKLLVVIRSINPNIKIDQDLLDK